jgi:hypothetical protein
MGLFNLLLNFFPLLPIDNSFNWFPFDMSRSPWIFSFFFFWAFLYFQALQDFLGLSCIFSISGLKLTILLLEVGIRNQATESVQSWALLYCEIFFYYCFNIIACYWSVYF